MNKPKRGGRRPGAGRPQTDRSPLNTVATPETRRRLAAIDSKPSRAIEIAASYSEIIIMNEQFKNFLKSIGAEFRNGGWRIRIGSNNNVVLTESERRVNDQGGKMLGRTAKQAVEHLALNDWTTESGPARELLESFGLQRTECYDGTIEWQRPADAA